MAGILVLGVLLWVTEAIPLFATSLLIIGLQVALIANPGNWSGLGFANGQSPSAREVLGAAADPILLLFFGGFLLSHAAVKEGVERVLANLLLRPFGTHPRQVLLGLLVVTMLFSMWMSNTATAAMMLALAAPLLAVCPPGDRFRKALLLAVAFGANIGGLGTPIASPPNALALGFLHKAGHDVSFAAWMSVAGPLMLLMLLFTWILLWKLFPPTSTELRFSYQSERLSTRGWFVTGVFALTALFWITDTRHGVPSAVVALMPMILLTASGIFTAADLGKIEWSVLLLVAGGISLGSGMQLTGLDQALVRLLPLSEAGGRGTLALLVFGTIALGTFMSNTAAANLLLPIGITVGMKLSVGATSTVQIAVCIALAASMSMALPISTPPNAMAYARGELTIKDLAVPGLVVGTVAGLLITFGSGYLLRWLGVM